MKRCQIYLSTRQLDHLARESVKTELDRSEILRRIIDKHYEGSMNLTDESLFYQEFYKARTSRRLGLDYVAKQTGIDEQVLNDYEKGLGTLTLREVKKLIQFYK